MCFVCRLLISTGDVARSDDWAQWAACHCVSEHGMVLYGYQCYHRAESILAQII